MFNLIHFIAMATTPKRDKVQTVKVTLQDVSKDTISDRFHFTIKENDAICQTDKEGNDIFTNSFSKPFSCLLSTLKTDFRPIRKIRIKTANNPSAYNGAASAIFCVLDVLIGKEIEITRHFAHKGDVINGFAMTTDKWVTDAISFVDIDGCKKEFEKDDFKEDFAEYYNAIEEDDDF
jgi:hypothetical protein